MLVMVVFFLAFRWIHLSTPLIRLFLLVLLLLLMPTLNFLPVWFALSLLRFRLPSRLPMMFILWMVDMMVVIIPSRTVCLLTSFPVRRAIMFMLVSWFGLTLPLLNAADWFRWVCKLLMLICILTKNVITSCSVTMMLFLHLEVKPLMTLTTVLYLSCALISGHLAMMLMELTKRR